MIDYIYYTATSTDIASGTQTVIEGSYYIPFLDFLFIWLLFVFTILFIYFFNFFVYKKDKNLNIKNNIRISKRLKF